MEYQRNLQGYDSYDEDPNGSPTPSQEQDDSESSDDDRGSCLGETLQAGEKLEHGRYTMPGEYRDDTLGQTVTYESLSRKALIVTICILLYLALSVKFPKYPSVTVSNPVLNHTQPFTLRDGKLSFNVGMNVTMDNPNNYDMELKRIELNLIYPIKSYPIGGVVKERINLGPNAKTNITFPLSLDFHISNTSGVIVLFDIMKKCRANQDLTVDYDLKWKFSTRLIKISSTTMDSLTFACPDELENMLSGLLGTVVFGGILGTLMLCCLPGSSFIGGIIWSIVLGYFLKR